ncbi:MAG: ribbon-helix-helix protein, CopG family [Mesorhizobium sp.]|nr:ribbon-helix-helix protein, CopG family [Mesorhizobium sp.]MBL8578895.1 ribbon-helix-helix protein, CopG family [Mesorhizobium sp.]
MVKSANLALRIPVELKEALDQAAKEDRRSVSSLVEKVLMEHLETKGFLPKGAAE